MTYHYRRKKKQRHAAERHRKTRPTGPRIPIRSNTASTTIAGPSVISRNNSDGGYLVQFKNEKTVRIGVC